MKFFAYGLSGSKGGGGCHVSALQSPSPHKAAWSGASSGALGVGGGVWEENALPTAQGRNESTNRKMLLWEYLLSAALGVRKVVSGFLDPLRAGK